jgi:hypothetical protein
MHACETCMFCHYRNLRIAAFAAREGAAPEGESGVGSNEQPSLPTVAQQLPPRPDPANREALAN